MSAASIERRFAEVARQVGKPLAVRAGTVSVETWWSTDDLAAYLGLTDRQRPREAARDWADRQRPHLAFIIVNRERRYAPRDIERAIERQRHAGRVRLRVA